MRRSSVLCDNRLEDANVEEKQTRGSFGAVDSFLLPLPDGSPPFAFFAAHVNETRARAAN